MLTPKNLKQEVMKKNIFLTYSGNKKNRKQEVMPFPTTHENTMTKIKLNFIKENFKKLLKIKAFAS